MEHYYELCLTIFDDYSMEMHYLDLECIFKGVVIESRQGRIKC